MLEMRSLLATILFAVTTAAPAVADDTPGVTATEINLLCVQPDDVAGTEAMRRRPEA
jgi:hypothetical protein